MKSRARYEATTPVVRDSWQGELPTPLGDAIAGKHVDETVAKALVARCEPMGGRGPGIAAREKEVGMAGATFIEVRG